MVIFHADDYGIHPDQAERILECRRNGCLNSLSIMPNSPYLQECMGRLDKGLLYAVHINLAEGPCCADKREIPLLVDKRGYFKLSFVQLLAASFVKNRMLRCQIKKECMAQIKAVCRHAEPGYRLRLDSHVHYHMIPVVFRGLCDACEQLGIEAEAVRWPVEPLRLVLKEPGVWKDIPWVNLLKTVVLHICAFLDYPVLIRHGWKDRTAVFFGILFTGRMKESVVRRLLPRFEEYAAKKGRNLEVLLHPGWISQGEYVLDEKYAGFYRSKYRKAESETLKKIKKKL